MGVRRVESRTGRRRERLLGGGDGSYCMIRSLAAARESGGAYIAACAFQKSHNSWSRVTHSKSHSASTEECGIMERDVLQENDTSLVRMPYQPGRLVSLKAIKALMSLLF